MVATDVDGAVEMDLVLVSGMLVITGVKGRFFVKRMGSDKVWGEGIVTVRANDCVVRGCTNCEIVGPGENPLGFSVDANKPEPGVIGCKILNDWSQRWIGGPVENEDFGDVFDGLPMGENTAKGVVPVHAARDDRYSGGDGWGQGSCEGGGVLGGRDIAGELEEEEKEQWEQENVEVGGSAEGGACGTRRGKGGRKKG